MTSHLSSDEFFQAADGSLAADRLAHAAACATCRAAVEETRAFVSALAAVDVPEPSPLFWDHFAARVREATAAEPLALAPSLWHRVFRPAFALGATTAAALFAVWLVRQPMVPSIAPAGETPATSLESVMALTVGWSADELDQLVPGDDAGALFIEELSGDERAAFAQVLRDELAVVQ